MCQSTLFIFFFFNDTATTEIYTLSLHDALPILRGSTSIGCGRRHQKLVISCKGICRPSFLSIKRSFAPFPNRPVNETEPGNFDVSKTKTSCPCCDCKMLATFTACPSSSLAQIRIMVLL